MRKIILLVSVLLFSILFQPLSATIYSKVSGKVVDEKTGKGIEGVSVKIFKSITNSFAETYSDKKGEFSIPDVPSGIYGILFEPPEPYAWDNLDYRRMAYNKPMFPTGMKVFTVPKGENVYILRKCKIGGVLEIKVFEKDTDLPIKDIDIHIEGANWGLITDHHNTNSQGIYRLSRLSAGKIDISMKIDGIWIKKLKNVEIKFNKTTRIDVPYDLKSRTKITGSLKCEGAREPLNDVMVFIDGEKEESQCRSDKNGLFSMLDMKPGRYEVGVVGYLKIDGKEKRIDFTKNVLLTKGNPVNVNFILDCSIKYRKEGY